MNTSVTATLVLVGFLANANVGAAHSAPSDPLVLASQTNPKRPAASARPAASQASISRSSTPIVTVSTTGEGQAGYIHYFVITGPDGEPETQVGIELPDDRIAWSFPELGVVISPFIASGSITTSGKSYDVQHLYGMRPFRDELSMHKLQQELALRVAPWIDEKIHYCDEERPPNQVCVSCLGFVLRVLYPSPSSALAAVPVLPADFKSGRRNLYTTEDLLLYLAGVPLDVPRQTRLARIEALIIPEHLREELARISNETDSLSAVASATRANRPKAVNAKSRAPVRSIVDLPKRVLTRHRS
jgi:hypothetical protein